MKNIIFTSLIFTLSIGLFAQNDNTPYDFVTVVIEEQDGTDQKVSYYPEGTTYQIWLTKKDSEPNISNSMVTYEGDMHLSIFPKYRKHKADKFDIKGKRLRIFKTAETAFNAGFAGEWNYLDKKDKGSSIQNNEAQSGKITLNKKLTASKINDGTYNATLTFSNGIVFKYFDGKFNAKLNGEYINIKNRYIIETDKGTLKFSYNPKTGKVWWIYENTNAE